MTTAQRIRSIRREKGLTQKALGEILGVSQATVGQYETNKNPPKIATLERIAVALGVPLLALIDSGQTLEKEKTIQSKFAELLGKRKMKISEVQRLTGISRTTLTDLFYNRGSGISYNVLARLCSALDCGIDDIFEVLEANGSDVQ